MKKNIVLILLLLSFSVNAEIIKKEITYTATGTKMTGYLAYDNSLHNRPGIIVVHEWWGHNDYARKRADMLAAEGYTAFALDMYGDGKQAGHPKEAMKFSGEVKKQMPVAKKRFLAAIDVLKNNSTTNPSQISAIGYCFGGGIVLEMMRMGVDLDAVVSFHGSLNTSNPVKSKRDTKVLVLNGEADPFTKPETIAAFKKEMSSAGIDYEFVNYPGAMHAFTNPDATELGKKFKLPLAYNKQADIESWQKMKSFFKHVYH